MSNDTTATTPANDSPLPAWATPELITTMRDRLAVEGGFSAAIDVPPGADLEAVKAETTALANVLGADLYFEFKDDKAHFQFTLPTLPEAAPVDLADLPQMPDVAEVRAKVAAGETFTWGVFISDNLATHLADQIAKDLALERLHIDFQRDEAAEITGLTIRQRTVEEVAAEAPPLPAPGSTDLLDTLRGLRDKLAANSKSLGPIMLGIPRELSLRLIGEYAAATQKIVSMAELAALKDRKQAAQLFVIDGLPVLAFPMTAPMLCAWDGPAPAQFNCLEEHPDYPGTPFSRRIWDEDRKRVPKVINNCRTAALEVAQRPVSLFLSAAPFMAAVPAFVHDNDVSTPIRDDDPTLAEFERMVTARRADILAVLDQDRVFAFEVTHAPEVVERIKHILETHFHALAESTKRPGGSIRVSLRRRLIVS